MLRRDDDPRQRQSEDNRDPKECATGLPDIGVGGQGFLSRPRDRERSGLRDRLGCRLRLCGRCLLVECWRCGGSLASLLGERLGGCAHLRFSLRLGPVERPRPLDQPRWLACPWRGWRIPVFQLPQGVSEFGCGGVAPGGVLGQQGEEEVVPGRRDRGTDRAGRGRGLGEVGGEVAHGVRGLEGQAAGDHFEEQAAEGVQVAARLRRAARLLGCHVGRGTDDEAGLGEALLGGVGVSGAGDAEVEDLDRTGRCDLDVGGLDIAVQHLGLVRLGECVADLGPPAGGVMQRYRAAANHGLQGLAAQQLHHQERGMTLCRAGLAQVVDCDDVGVLQGRGDAGFALEPGAGHVAPAAAACQQSNHLDCDGPSQNGVVGFPDLPHTALAQLPRQLVPPTEHAFPHCRATPPRIVLALRSFAPRQPPKHRWPRQEADPQGIDHVRWARMPQAISPCNKG